MSELDLAALRSVEPTEVTLARAVLEKHYGEPVYPVSQFCAALRQWGDAIHAAWEKGYAIGPGFTPGKDWHQFAGEIWLAAHKSSLLGRLLWWRETFRTEQCPEHQGHWSGLEFIGHRTCVHGCQLTGWLPAEKKADE